MKASKLENNQYSVLSAEYSTGKILTTDFIRYNGYGEEFHILDTYDLALDFIYAMLSEQSNLEFIVYDSNGEYIMTIDSNGRR